MLDGEESIDLVERMGDEGFMIHSLITYVNGFGIDIGDFYISSPFLHAVR